MTRLPLYKEVKNRIVEGLIAGEWRPGDVMPSEPRLAKHYGVGINTLRAALSELVAANILLRRQGKGTFVSLHASAQNIYSFFNLVRADGIRELPARRMLSLRKVAADNRTADLLQLPRTRTGSTVFRMKIQITLSGTPVAVSEIAVPTALFPGLERRGFEDGSVSLYGLYQESYGVTIIRTRDMLGAVKAQGADAQVLAVRTGEPLLEITRVAYTFNARPVEIRTTRAHTGNYRYLVEHGSSV